MGMVTKEISLPEEQSDWFMAEIETGQFRNESEVIQELIDRIQKREQELKLREQETLEEIKAILEGVKNGISNRTVDGIWEDALLYHFARHA